MPAKRRVAIKLAYDGSRFFGYQRQPERRTVEGDLVNALVSLGALGSTKAGRFQSSSRTDRGVSALGNVVSFDTDFSLTGLCPALNSEIDDTWVYAVSVVPEDFNPRWARQRWYRYHLPRGEQDLALLRELCGRFVGTHDFSTFSRKDDRDPVRTIESVDVGESQNFLILDFRAESFLWNMVRRIVWMVDAGSSGVIDHDEVGPEACPPPRRAGLAPAEFLLLMNVDCGVDFSPDPRSLDHVRGVFDRRLLKALLEQEFSRHVLSALER
jgi:tRNA pseudouridine38-40 synthase